MNRKAFSLIELSIVLIIIGLLVAGIVGGQSLIRSARLSTVVSDFRNIELAANAFYVQEGRFPGSDGSSYQVKDPTGDYDTNYYFWKDLYDAGIYDFNPTKLSEASDESDIFKNMGKFSPKSKFPGAYYQLYSGGIIIDSAISDVCIVNVIIIFGSDPSNLATVGVFKDGDIERIASKLGLLEDDYYSGYSPLKALAIKLKHWSQPGCSIPPFFSSGGGGLE